MPVMGAPTLFATKLVKSTQAVAPTQNLLATKPVGQQPPAPSSNFSQYVAPSGPSAPPPTNVAPIPMPPPLTTQPAPIVAQPTPTKAKPMADRAEDPVWYEPEPNEPYHPSAPIPVPRPTPQPSPVYYQPASEVKASVDMPAWMWIAGALALAGAGFLVAKKKKWV